MNGGRAAFTGRIGKDAEVRTTRYETLGTLPHSEDSVEDLLVSC